MDAAGGEGPETAELTRELRLSPSPVPFTGPLQLPTLSPLLGWGVETSQSGCPHLGAQLGSGQCGGSGAGVLFLSVVEWTLSGQ